MSVELCYPVLETDEIHYSVQPGCGFLDDGYYRATYSNKTRRGQVHPAIDLNDVRGKNSDLGNRVRAIAEGEVVAADDYPAWGGIVLIRHPEFGVRSQSAHLTGITVKAGQRVRMGDVIGHIGRGEHDRYWAHLHFELRVSDLPPDFWPSARFATSSKAAIEKYVREHYLDPEEWLIKHGALRTLAEVEQVRRSWAMPPIVVPRPEVPPAATIQDIPPTPQGVSNPLAPGTPIALFGPDNGPLYTASGVAVTHIKLQRRTLPGLETQYKAVAIIPKEK